MVDNIRVTTCSVFLWGVVVPTGGSYGELCAQCEHLPPVIRTPVTIIHDKQSVLSSSSNFVVPSQFNPSQVMSTADSPTKPTAARPQLPYSHMNPFLSPGWFNFLSPVFLFPCLHAFLCSSLIIMIYIANTLKSPVVKYQVITREGQEITVSGLP